MKPDGSNPTMLVGNAQGAHALDYHFGYSSVSAGACFMVLTLLHSFFYSSNKLFWTSPEYDRVYQANLGDGLDLTERHCNVSKFS